LSPIHITAKLKNLYNAQTLKKCIANTCYGYLSKQNKKLIRIIQHKYQFEYSMDASGIIKILGHKGALKTSELRGCLWNGYLIGNTRFLNNRGESHYDIFDNLTSFVAENLKHAEFHKIPKGYYPPEERDVLQQLECDENIESKDDSIDEIMSTPDRRIRGM